MPLVRLFFLWVTVLNVYDMFARWPKHFLPLFCHMKWKIIKFDFFLPVQLKASVPFEFSMTEIKEMWGDDLGGKELHFKGWISDWYFLNTQNGTSVTKILKDGVKLRILGKKLRTFKPGTPVTIYVSVKSFKCMDILNLIKDNDAAYLTIIWRCWVVYWEKICHATLFFR